MIDNNNKKIFICATEQSGDNIGANLIAEIHNINKSYIFDGVGGSLMSKYLNKQYFSLKDFNAMGIFEIFFSIKKFIKMINYLVNQILITKYDLIITIDSPDFNYPLIKKLRKKNVKTKIIQIVAPSVWAWREYRAKKFSKIFDELFVLFEFEKKYFIKHGLKTTFIGHPIFYINSLKLNLNESKFIAFLPGSRESEIKSLMPYFNLAYEYLLENNPDINIFIPTLPHLKDLVQQYTCKWNLNVILASDKTVIDKYYGQVTKALVCSGTASLEIAKRNIPQLIIYKFNFFTFFLAKFLIKIKYANILNIINNKLIIPEITNSDLNKKLFIKEFELLITNNKKNSIQIKSINNVIYSIIAKDPPYLIASRRIVSYLN